MLKKLREKCAFTLVELIVVLVILAILTALLVPALTGYIDKSRKSQVIAETRALHEAIQTEMVEYYASSSWDKLSENLGRTLLMYQNTLSLIKTELKVNRSYTMKLSVCQKFLL